MWLLLLYTKPVSVTSTGKTPSQSIWKCGWPASAISIMNKWPMEVEDMWEGEKRVGKKEQRETGVVGMMERGISHKVIVKT